MRKTIAALAGAVGALGAGQALAQESLVDAIAAGKPIFEVRGRYENVDQAGIADAAEAMTLRTRFGWETADWYGFKALVEIDDVRVDGGYNDAVGPAEPQPTIADPAVTEFNRAQITWSPVPQAAVTAGRQRIILDDARFVGNVGWRQDEQTYDGVRGDFTVGKLSLTAAWIGQVNRVFAEAADWDSDSWLLRASYPVSDLFTPAAFVYALDFDQSPAASTLTTGVRVTGKTRAGPVGVSYAASYAHQSDYADNPGDVGLDYAAVDLAGTYGVVTLKGSYEMLEGDGTRGFATPLATLHAFQGWADVFLTTPADGIEDVSASLSAKPPVGGPFKSLNLTAVWHNFEAERTGASLGEELDLVATAAVSKNLTALIKYADYDGAPGYADRTKLWLGFEFKL